MNITLKINGENKTFEAGFVTLKTLREAIVLVGKMETAEGSMEILDILIDFEVLIYGNQFTKEELEEGFLARDFFKKATEDMNQIMGDFNKSTKN